MSSPPRILPPGVQESEFDQALDLASDAIGADNVSRSAAYGALAGPHGQTAYGDVYRMRPKDEHEAAGAFRPENVSELQALLKIANDFNIPLWTISRGKNLGYGGSSPVVQGSVVLDLHRMKKIIEVNEQYAYAVVEPGVTFFDLYEYIQERGYKLWMSVPALGWGSIIGNCTERGFGYTPNGEHAQQQCGMEVVLADGEILRTGMWAMDGNPMANLYKAGLGPDVGGLFFQSNLGIVTKMGMHLMHAPDHYMDCTVSVPNEDDLAILVGKISHLERHRHIDNHASIANIWRQCTASGDPDVYKRTAYNGGVVDPKVLLEIQKEKGWGYWKAYFAVYGPKEVCDVNWKITQKAFADVPGVQFEATAHSGKNGSPIRAQDVPEGHIPHTGSPTISALPVMDIRGKFGGHIDFSPVFPSGGTELQDWYYNSAKKRLYEAKLDFWSDFHVWGRYTIAIIVVIYGPHEAERADRLYKDLMHDSEKNNISEYRTHIDYMDDMAKLFNFNGGAINKFVNGLKDHFDPKGILSPGKSGIWNSGSLLKQNGTKSHL